MKRTYKFLAITILALLGSFALPLTECEEIKQEEKLYFEVSIGVIAGDTVFSKNIRFIFKNLEEGGLPFNRNLEAFSEGFKSLRVELIPEGSRFVLFFDIFYDSSVGHSKAISYANEAIHHILDNIFEYNIQELGNHTETKGSKIEVKSTYGYGETSLQEISKFIKYKPTTELGRLLNEKLLAKYVPGISNTTFCSGILRISYTIKRYNSGFFWDFEIYCANSKALSREINNHKEVVDLNELLNNEGWLVTNPSNVKIIGVIDKRSFKGTYSIELKEIRPDGYNLDSSDPYLYVIEFDSVSFPLRNVIVELTINSTNPNDDGMETLYAIFLIILIGSIMVFLLLKKLGGKNMEIKKKLKNQLLATFICTLMLITPHTTAQLYANFIDQ